MLFTFNLLLSITVILAILGTFRTFQIEHSSNQKKFVAASLPSPLPEGFYKGSVTGKKVKWLGKKFHQIDSSGINVFEEMAGITSEKYPFKTYVGTGIRDIETAVLKIDYNLPENPWWLKPVLDEVVQIAPGAYLGKLHVRIIPNYPFTVEYFNLIK